MNIAKKNLVYFSPTGSTKKVVELVGSVWDPPESIIDLSDEKTVIDSQVFEQNELL